MKIRPVNRHWRCACSVFCVSMCSRHATREDCPAFFTKYRKEEFTEDFVPQKVKLNHRNNFKESSRWAY